MKEWSIIVIIVLLIVVGIWWLVRQNSGSLSGNDAGQGEQEKKGAITEGLHDGKDYGTDYKTDEKALFQVLVVLRDQKYDRPEEDRAQALKRGDVLAVRKMPHLWSDTERASYLIVPIEMTGKDADALIAPKRENDQQTIARAESIDLDKVGFSGDDVTASQPLEDKKFDTNIIRGK